MRITCPGHANWTNTGSGFNGTDAALLMLAVGFGIGWWIDRSRLTKESKGRRFVQFIPGVITDSTRDERDAEKNEQLKGPPTQSFGNDNASHLPLQRLPEVQPVEPTMDSSEQVLRLLTEIRDGQREAIAEYKRTIKRAEIDRQSNPFKFSIRDLLLVTVIVAILVAWWIDRQRLSEPKEPSKPKQTILDTS